MTSPRARLLQPAETSASYVAGLVAEAAAADGRSSTGAVADLIAQVEAASVPGRGEEFTQPLRLAAGVLAQRLLDQHDPGPAREVRAPRRGVLVLGAPLSVAATLRANGLPAARPRKPTSVVVVGRPLEQGIAEVWSAQVREGRNRTWPGFVGGLAARDRLPPRAQFTAIARRWSRQVGADNVHLVTAAGPVPGLRRFTVAHAAVDAAATEAIRETSVLLGILAAPATHARILDERLVPLTSGDGTGPRIHDRLAPWLVRRGAGLVREAGDAGYSLHGDPAVLGQRGTGSVLWPSAAEAQPATLAAVVRTLLATCEETS